MARGRLLDALDEIAPGGVGLIVAPAGSGKSVLIEQWSDRGNAADGHRDREAAIVRIDERSRDPIVLARQLAEAVGHGGEEIELVQRARPGRDDLGPAFVGQMLRALGARPRPLDLILDDVHLLEPLQGLADDAARILGSLPPSVRVVLCGRRDPARLLQRLRLDGRLVEIRSDDLAFTLDESAALIAEVAGREIPASTLAPLVERTEGWAAGLQLAGISLRTVDDPTRLIAEFGGADGLVAEYLTAEVLSRAKPELRTFLLQTAHLPWLAPGLCASVVDGLSPREAATRIEDLRDASLFVVPTDPVHRRLRYHHLFADLLSFQLEIEQPELLPELRARAATWFEANGHPSEAADQFVALGAADAVLRVVRRHGHEYFARSELATVTAWLEPIATQDGPAELQIDLLAAQMGAHRTQAMRDTYRVLRQRHDLTSGQRAAIEALYACSALDDLSVDETLRASNLASAEVAAARAAGVEVSDFLGIGGEDSVEAMATYTRGLAELHGGDLRAAADTLTGVLDLGGSGYSLWRITTLATLALVRSWTGRHRHAVADADAALEIAAAVDAPYHHSVTHAHLALAMTALDRLDLAAADRHLGHAEVCCQRTGWAADRALHQTLAGLHRWARDGVAPPPQTLAPLVPPATTPPIVACAAAANQARLLAVAGAIDQARSIVEQCPAGGPRAAASIDVALFAGDAREAARSLAAWHPTSGHVREVAGHHLRAAVVADALGDREGARRGLDLALADCEIEQIRSVFTEVPGALELLRSGSHPHRHPFAASILATVALMPAPARERDTLIEPLTGRERDLLPYLPTRMSNREIAAELCVSVNTIKTHLRHIYWKLGVEDRDQAVARAAELGLHG